MRRQSSMWLVLCLLLGTMAYAIAEEMTLTTYYPSPRGVYHELRVTGNLLAAYEEGRVGIGTEVPEATLDVHTLGPLVANAGWHLRVTDTDGGFLLVVDPEGQVGIGTEDPAALLEVHAAGPLPDGSAGMLSVTDVAGNSLLSVGINGRVGVGTADPQAPLHIQSSEDAILRLENAAGGNVIEWYEGNDQLFRTGIDLQGNFLILPEGADGIVVTSGGNVEIEGRVGIGTDDLGTAQLTVMGGNVGIGTTAPTQALDVNGQVRIRGGDPEEGKVLTATDTEGVAEWGTSLPSGAIVMFGTNDCPPGWSRASAFDSRFPIGSDEANNNSTHPLFPPLFPPGGPFGGETATAFPFPGMLPWEVLSGMLGMDFPLFSIGSHFHQVPFRTVLFCQAP